MEASRKLGTEPVICLGSHFSPVYGSLGNKTKQKSSVARGLGVFLAPLFLPSVFFKSFFHFLINNACSGLFFVSYATA